MKIGDRMKRYEQTTRGYATRRMPLIVRVDGRAFHTLTRGAKKPFCPALMSSMQRAAGDVMLDMQGCKVAYVQSDEATFCLTDYDDHETQGWFDYNIQKVVSISAALMSVSFVCYYQAGALPVFDSRAFNVPKEDVANMFLWRAKDWQRNSLQMYARSFFSHRQLHRKTHAQIHEMLHEIGKNWATDLSDREKNGVFLINAGSAPAWRTDIEPRYDTISALVDPLIGATVPF